MGEGNERVIQKFRGMRSMNLCGAWNLAMHLILSEKVGRHARRFRAKAAVNKHMKIA